MTLERFKPIHQWTCGKKYMKSSFHQRYIFLIFSKQEFSALLNSSWEMFQWAYYGTFVSYSHAPTSTKHLPKICCRWGTVGFQRWVRHSSFSPSKQSSLALREERDNIWKEREEKGQGESEMALRGANKSSKDSLHLHRLGGEWELGLGGRW